MRSLWVSFLCLPMFVFLLGCGGTKIVLPQSVPMTGKITLDGEPLAEATVVFTPTKAGGTTAMGVTDEGGNYELFISASNVRQAGAVPGDYKVQVSTLLPPPKAGDKVDPVGTAVRQEKVPQKYTRLESTPLKAKVENDGGSQDFELKSK